MLFQDAGDIAGVFGVILQPTDELIQNGALYPTGCFFSLNILQRGLHLYPCADILERRKNVLRNSLRQGKTIHGVPVKQFLGHITTAIRIPVRIGSKTDEFRAWMLVHVRFDFLSPDRRAGMMSFVDYDHRIFRRVCHPRKSMVSYCCNIRSQRLPVVFDFFPSAKNQGISHGIFQ